MRSTIVLSLSILSILASTPALVGAQATVKGGSATGGSATGGSAVGGNAVGGSAVGGSAVGGDAVGGSVTSGSVSSGASVGGTATATGGTATAGTATPGTATATIGGRRISATSDSGVSIQSEGQHARVELGGDVLVIESDRILVNGQERATIPRSTDLVQIRNAGGMVTVRAGKTEVLSERIGGR